MDHLIADSDCDRKVVIAYLWKQIAGRSTTAHSAALHLSLGLRAPGLGTCTRAV